MTTQAMIEMRIGECRARLEELKSLPVTEAGAEYARLLATHDYLVETLNSWNHLEVA